MKQELLSISKHTIVYTSGIIISKAISFIMLPVYTHYLTPPDYGIMELVSMTIDIITMITGLGITGAVFKFYYEHDGADYRNKVIGTSFVVIAAISAATAAAGYLSSEALSAVVFRTSEYSHYFELSFLIYFLQTCGIIPNLQIRILKNSKFFVAINLIRLFFQVSFNIAFLVVMNMGIAGVLYSSLISEALITLYLYGYLVRNTVISFSMDICKKLVSFGYPLVFASLSSFVITYSDRYFLNIYTDLTTVGIYSLAYKFGFIMGYLAVGPFMQIWEPQRFELAKQENARKIFRKVFLYFNILILTVSLVLSLFVKDLLTLLSDSSYHQAHMIAPVIILAYILQAWTFYCNFGIYLEDKSKLMALSYLASAAGNIALNFILIPRYGAFGAAWATAGAFLIRFLLVNMFSQRLYRIDYEWGRNLLPLAAAVAIYLFSASIKTDTLAQSLAINLLLLGLSLMLVYRFILDKDEKKALTGLLKGPLSLVKNRA